MTRRQSENAPQSASNRTTGGACHAQQRLHVHRDDGHHRRPGRAIQAGRWVRMRVFCLSVQPQAGAFCLSVQGRPCPEPRPGFRLDKSRFPCVSGAWIHHLTNFSCCFHTCNATASRPQRQGSMGPGRLGSMGGRQGSMSPPDSVSKRQTKFDKPLTVHPFALSRSREQDNQQQQASPKCACTH